MKRLESKFGSIEIDLDSATTGRAYADEITVNGVNYSLSLWFVLHRATDEKPAFVWYNISTGFEPLQRKGMGVRCISTDKARKAITDYIFAEALRMFQDETETAKGHASRVTFLLERARGDVREAQTKLDLARERLREYADMSERQEETGRPVPFCDEQARNNSRTCDRPKGHEGAHNFGPY